MKDLMITIMWKVSVEHLNAEEALEKLRESGEAEIVDVAIATKKEVKKMRKAKELEGVPVEGIV